jgi:hypothetical protein
LRSSASLWPLCRAVERTEDAAGVLDEPSLLGDRRGEEESVERGAVESLSGVRTGGDSEQGRSSPLWLEPGECSGPCLSAHAAPQHDRIMAHAEQYVGELV